MFRKWAAIGTLAAALEQRVWIQTTGMLFPNLYTWLIGNPGIGKSRAITLSGQFLRQLPDCHVAPTSVTAASLVDFMVDHPTNISAIRQLPVTYNSATLLADELTAFASDYSNDMIGLLTTMYDVVVPYGQKRRGKDINKFIERPQINAIVGTSPSNLMKYVPDYAWDQGFTSRVILIYSNERILVEDIFGQKITETPKSMVHDLNIIRSLYGEFTIDTSFREVFNRWRKEGCKPAPEHPRLVHYCTRRWAHLLKLSMVSAIDRGGDLTMTAEDFECSKNWLTEAEDQMGRVFSEGIATPDSKAQDELLYFIRTQDKGQGVSGDRIVRHARKLLPIYSVTKTIEILEQSGAIKPIKMDLKSQMKTYRINDV